MDVKTELANALARHEEASKQLRTAVDNLHLADIHLTNVRDILNRQAPKRELSAYLVENSTENATKLARLKKYLDVFAASTVRRIVMYISPTMLVAGFAQELKQRGLSWDVDNVWTWWTKLDAKGRIEYIQRAANSGIVTGWIFDDAQNQTPEQVAPIIRAIRDFSDAPVRGSFAMSDTRKDATGKQVRVDIAGFAQADMLIYRQAYPNLQNQPERDAASIMDYWFKQGLRIDGIDLPAFPANREEPPPANEYTPSPKTFNLVLDKCLSAGIRDFTVYAPVENDWLIWQRAQALWQAVQDAAVRLREVA